jgi:hypothetical protein
VLLGLGLAASAAPRTARPLPYRSVHGTLESVDERHSSVVVRSDDGQLVAWRFEKRVVAQVARFKPGDPIVVIYRQQASAKTVTAVAFPGAAPMPVYVNTTGERVELVSGPMVDGACSLLPDAPLHTTTIPVGARVEIADACWCCAPAGGSCAPANRTGAGQAFLARCFQ